MYKKVIVHLPALYDDKDKSLINQNKLCTTDDVDISSTNINEAQR